VAGDPDLLAVVRLAPGRVTDEGADRLAALENRRTDRRGGADWPVPPQRLLRLADIAEDEGARVVVVSDPGAARRAEELLEAARQHCPESPFVFMSTNKVYGDAPNEKPLVELATRWEYRDPIDHEGIDETCRVDASLHSVFGASKLSADIMVQEYGRYFGMPTVCFRGGCLTGPNHSAAELHGFLAYVLRAVREGRAYRIYGYKGKQVRDNLHSFDVCSAFLEFYKAPRSAAVYNLGGGRANSVSVLEAIERGQDLLGRRLTVEYVETSRVGDHITYISDLRKWRADYPGWHITRSLDDIFRELAGR